MESREKEAIITYEETRSPVVNGQAANPIFPGHMNADDG
jgi:hypothetical protein